MIFRYLRLRARLHLLRCPHCAAYYDRGLTTLDEIAGAIRASRRRPGG